ncbi:hypothetical protein [Maridesulfovibrio zosterae]|uniref:hypothetical protein n=1 Tax=Maridesulfovibrio zosterae TaxID=82171 RepID=UPI0003F6AC4B|nr:hypothetical protein [Maridesulfovibrio zosterae]
MILSEAVYYFAMRGFGFLDNFPVGGLGVIKALTYGDNKPSHKEVLGFAEKWSTYLDYATLCLWIRWEKLI